MLSEHSHGIRLTLDAVAGIAAFGALAKILPPVAAALSIIWLTIQLTEWAIRKLMLMRAR